MVEVLATKEKGPGILRALAQKGRGKDDRIALLTEKQRGLLKRLGGSGKVNPKTGLREYDEGEGGEGGVGAGATESSSVGADGVGGDNSNDSASTSSSVGQDGQALGPGEDTSGAKGFDSSADSFGISTTTETSPGFGKDQGIGTTIGTNNMGFGPGVSFGAPSSVSSSVSSEGKEMSGPTANKGADPLGFADPTETLGKAEASMASQIGQALSPTTQSVTSGLLGLLGLSPAGPAIGLAAQNATPSTTENKGGVTASQAGSAIGSTMGMALGPLGAMAGGVLGGLAGGTLGAHGISSEQAAAENAANNSALGSIGGAGNPGIPAGTDITTSGSKALKPISGGDTAFSSSAGAISSPYTGVNTPGGTRLMADGGVMEGGLERLLAGKVRSVPGAGPGRGDNVPTSSPSGTFVMPADAVAAAGDGNNEAGAKKIAADLGAPHTKEKGKGSASAKTSSGEVLIEPAVVKRLGGGDLKKGQAMLTAFAKDKRAQMIMKLLGAKAPKMAGA